MYMYVCDLMHPHLDRGMYNLGVKDMKFKNVRRNATNFMKKLSRKLCTIFRNIWSGVIINHYICP